MRWLLPLALILLWGCDNVKIQRGGIEPPPPEYVGKPLAPGTRLVELGTAKEVDEACRAEGIGPNEWQRRSGKSTLECFSPRSQTLYIIRRGVVPDDYWNQLFAHGVPHSYGMVHPEGRSQGWEPGPPNVFATQPTTYDWGNAFGSTSQPPPASGANIFKGR